MQTESNQEQTEAAAGTDQVKAQAQFNLMVADAKRHLKRLSKNQLVRTVISQLVEIQMMKQALEEANQALEASTPTAPATEAPNA